MKDELREDLQQIVEVLRQERDDCPSAQQLIDYEALQAVERSAHSAHAHIQICSRCQLILFHLKEPTARELRSRWLWPVALPIAAALLAAFLLPRVYFRYFSPSRTLEETIRGTEIQLLSPIGPVLEVKEFRWRSPIRASRYRLGVYRASQLLHSSVVEKPPASRPSSFALEKGVEYSWQVEALDMEGEVRMRSPRQEFSVAR